MPDPPADTRQGEAVLVTAVAACRDAFGSRLAAAHALGSLAHGGFSPLVSDVDLGLVLTDPVRMSDRLTVRTVARAVRAGAVRAGGPALHERLSVFWGTPSTLSGQDRGGRFPPLDRLDLLAHGRLLTGQDARPAVARPGQAELLAAGAGFALGYLGGARKLADYPRAWARGQPRPGDAVTEIRNPPLLVSRGPRRLTKVVLFPVRFLFTAATGQVGTNALAAGHYLASPHAPGAELVAAAVGWRQAPPEDRESAAVLLGRELIPLYLHYLDDHIPRLRDLGQHRLARGFQRWRARLLA